jgi:uncharacterized iron-regulated membrane protein
MVATIASEAGKPRTSHFYLRMPTDDLPRAVVTTDSGGRYVDGTGRLGPRQAPTWTEFVIGLHEYLQLPATFGLILVGALGVALAALAITGVLAHPRILRDAFRLRTRHDPQIARADWHNRLGVWTLPFVLAVTITGAFLGLSSIGASMLARAYTGGSVERIYAPVFGGDPAPDPAPAPLPDIAAALRTLATRAPAAIPTYVIVHAPGSRGQHVQITAGHPRRLIFGETYRFDAGGRWRGKVGLSDGALGQQAAASAYNLHFGNYGGLLVELAYMLLGIALCGITATGVSLWLEKRQRRGLRSERLRASWDAVVWGTPLALVWLIWLRAVLGTDASLAASFWALLAGLLTLAGIKPGWCIKEHLRQALALSMVATAAVHLLVSDPQPFANVAIDASAFALAASILLLDAHRCFSGVARLYRPQ